MESKDWILLLVPVIINGIIFYLVQLYFQSKIKHNEHKVEVKRNINSQFFTLLFEAKNNFRDLHYCISQDVNNLEAIQQNLKKFDLSLQNIIYYYEDYNFYLKKYSQNIEQLENILEEYSTFCNQPRILNNAETKQMIIYLNKIFKELSNAMDCYLKEI